MLTVEQKAKIKAEHPNAKLVTVLGHEFAIQPASEVEWRRYQAYSRSGVDDKVSEAPKLLARACVVYPDLKELDAIFEKLPGMPSTLWAPCRKITGASEEAELSDL
jgi:hypothetical protein